ncbi:MAG TPA: homoserine dehydrogenase [Spirochaetota bacterium]|nr:homoserine dehydrogenase [Spirochaetota bacterium]
MKSFNVAIFGCGTVGGGVSRILLDMKEELSKRAGIEINLKRIVDMFPKRSSERHNIPLNLFCGNGVDLDIDETNYYIEEVLKSDDIDIVVETIGGSSEYILNIAKRILNSGKHFVTANKALLAKYNNVIFELASQKNLAVGFEASVCGAIPIIKVVKECFTGDEILSISGIMNGTSNYILSNMQENNLGFDEALKMAQQKGYAEADPTLDINGGDASHKLAILIKLAFGLDVKIENLSVSGIQNITKDDLSFAKEMDSTIKLICFATKKSDTIFATVRPMMVKNSNFISGINGATNAVKVVNKYSQEHILVGKGAGSLETGSAIVSDIIFIARYKDSMKNTYPKSDYILKDLNDYPFPYNIIFDAEDIPGITGLVTTSIGNQNINIDTVGHNRHNKDTAIFSIATMPCTLSQINKAIEEIKAKKPGVLKNEPKIIPILY